MRRETQGRGYVNLTEFRILSGERNVMARRSNKDKPQTLARLEEAGLIQNVREAQRWWFWDVTELGAQEAQRAQQVADKKLGLAKSCKLG